MKEAGLRHWGEVLREAGGPQMTVASPVLFQSSSCAQDAKEGDFRLAETRVCPAISKEEAGGNLQSPGLFPFLATFFLVTLSYQKRLQIDTESLAPRSRPSSYSTSLGHPLHERWRRIFLKEGFDWVVRVWRFLRTPELQSSRWQFRALRFQSGRVGCRHLSSPSQSSAEQLYFYMHCTFGVLHNILFEESIP